MSILTERQRRFATEYMIDANAMQAAIRAGYSKNYATAQSYKLLENVGIRALIDEKTKAIEDAKIAKADEVLRYLSQVMRGEQEEEVVVTEGEGDGYSKAVKVKRQVTPKDRISAAELLGKRYGVFVNKVQVSEAPKIVDDVGDEDE